jgi:integrase
MSRKVRDSNLDTRTARDKLKPRGKPYYRTIDKGLHLGYRKLRGAAGTWVGRFYVGDENYEVERIATADDSSDANGHDIMDYWQAATEARRRRDQRAKDTAAGVRNTGPYTVSNALADYFNWLRTDGRPEDLVADAERRAKAMIEPKLGNTEVQSLTAKGLRAWRDDLVKAGARTRTAKNEKQKHRAIEGADGLRKRQASVNRIFATLRAALNHAFREGAVASDHEWRKVKPFSRVDGKRTAFLEVDEAQRLVNACDGDFRLLVQAALLTGGRYSSLARLRVRDFHANTGTVELTTRKGNGSERPFPVTLTDEGIAFFRRVCLGRAKGDLMLTKNGHGWGKNNQVDPMKEACLRAKIEPIGFNQLRHTWATLALMNGTPDLIVAQNLGHTSTKMIEAHYAHITRKYAKERIQAGAPQFGFKPDNKVVGLS